MRVLRSLYCDDIRQELGGKVSLMGIYNGMMFLGDMPAALPRLCIHSMLSVPVDDPVQELMFELMMDNNVVLSVPSKVGSAITVPPNLLAPPVARTMTIATALSPFVVEAPCLLESRVRIGDEIVLGTRLHLVLAGKTSELVSPEHPTRT